jgi:uncharacterized protein YggE
MRIAAALLLATLACAANAQTLPFITVSGEGHANVAPEFAEFSAEVITRADSLEAATQKHSERAAKAVAVLRGLQKHGIAVERSSFRMQSQPGGAKAGAPKGTEFRAITTFTVKANQLGSLNEAISAIAGAGLFEVRSVRYGIKDEERVIDEARRAAVKNARRQAEVYADAAGVALGEILEISDGSAQNLGSEASLRLAAPNVQLSAPATIPFRAAITVKWRITSRP